jgi:hypothetical protein
MAVSVKKIVLWRTEVENKPGILATTLEPLVNAKVDLQVVMGYRYPGNEGRAAIEVCPVLGKKALGAAQGAGLSASSISTLLVEGDNKLGLGQAIAQAISGAGINLSFLLAQVIRKKYSAILGFESEEALRKAATLIKRVTAARKK